ncbi:MAG: hypothetical protein IKP00_16880 [Victivallales bacterium]|nr:hypothetical protein [Victivallales bacterium]
MKSQHSTGGWLFLIIGQSRVHRPASVVPRRSSRVGRPASVVPRRSSRVRRLRHD